MFGEIKLKALTDRALKHSTAETTQVSILGWEAGLTRFANSYIHQNVAEENINITVKCVTNRQIGEAGTNNPNNIEAIVEQAQSISRISPPNTDFYGFPATTKQIESSIETFIPATYEFSPLKRAEICHLIIRCAENLQSFGSFLTAALETVIANSNGLFAYNRSTSAIINATIIGKKGSGRAEMGARNANRINYNKLAESAVKKAKLAQNPIKIKVGNYDVVLEELAVAELLMFLSYFGFNGLRYQEGRSPFSGNLGQKMLGENITIWDDGLDTSGCPFPFDFEGIPKQKLVLVENGVVKSVVYDYTTAKKENRESTGHSSGSSLSGPIPLHLFMKGSHTSVEDLISSTKKGILVTRFWYTNIIDPMSLTITGMTRDGTFLIEDGKITKPVMNLRFTQSILEALSKVKAFSTPILVASGETYGAPFLFGSKVPALKIEDWNFTGISEH
ncbi:MAG: TldD/PmbA family protein [Candidatus Stahlbacteria bacterium]|nr:TldD/PmbA family protein [Candidatus Stahlbacteria bacterium]